MARVAWRFRRGFCAPRQVAEEISRFGAMEPHPQSVKSVLSCTEPTQLLEFLKEAQKEDQISSRFSFFTK